MLLGMLGIHVYVFGGAREKFGQAHPRDLGPAAPGVIGGGEDRVERIENGGAVIARLNIGAGAALMDIGGMLGVGQVL